MITQIIYKPSNLSTLYKPNPLDFIDVTTQLVQMANVGVWDFSDERTFFLTKHKPFYFGAGMTWFFFNSWRLPYLKGLFIIYKVKGGSILFYSNL